MCSGAEEKGETEAGWISPPASPSSPRLLPTRLDAAAPGTVLAASFLVSAGLVVCAAVTMPPVWILLAVLGEDPWPPASWVLGLAVCAVVAFSVFAALCGLFYNLISRWLGSIRLTLAEEAPAATGPEPGSPSDDSRTGPSAPTAAS
ncbi:hypothetical protein [Streptomyces sp. NPDC046985]|uniref:hypothetical protein n=1 Tax=Streptomyces sp. NPDC046985 TaxID=3155377 RepID=UPI0034086AE3